MARKAASVSASLALTLLAVGCSVDVSKLRASSTADGPAAQPGLGLDARPDDVPDAARDGLTDAVGPDATDTLGRAEARRDLELVQGPDMGEDVEPEDDAASAFDLGVDGAPIDGRGGPELRPRDGGIEAARDGRLDGPNANRPDGRSGDLRVGPLP